MLGSVFLSLFHSLFSRMYVICDERSSQGGGEKGKKNGTKADVIEEIVMGAAVLAFPFFFSLWLPGWTDFGTVHSSVLLLLFIHSPTLFFPHPLSRSLFLCAPEWNHHHKSWSPQKPAGAGRPPQPP